MFPRFPRVLQGLLHTAPTFQPDPGVEDFPTESGGLRQRRLFDHMPGVYSLTYVMTRADAAEFWNFYQCNVGQRFILPIVLPTQPFDDCLDYIARFVQASVPAQSHITPDRWVTEVQVRIERTAQTIAPVHDLYSFAGAQSQEFIDYLNDAVNVRFATAFGGT